MITARVGWRALSTTVIVLSMLTSGVAQAVPPVTADSEVQQTDTVVVRWNEMVLDSVRNSHLGPPMVARAIAVVNTCMYDAWAAYDATAAGTRYQGGLRRPPAERTVANKSEAISYAAHRAAVDLFGDRRPQLDAFMASLGYDPNRVGSTAARVGVTACAAVLDHRDHDLSNEADHYADWSGYRPLNQPMVVARPLDPATVRDPNRWQPLTYPDRSGATVTPGFLGAHWGYVQPFALIAGFQYRSGNPPARYGSSTYAAQAREVLDITANLTDHQKAIAEYWADGPNSEQPPGHWNLFGQFVSRRDHHTLDQDAKMFFALTNAILDASIAAWDDKRAFDYVRPITAIRYLYRGQQVRSWPAAGGSSRYIDGATWTPYQATWFPTPPFPEYASGHSAFSSAAAEVLRRFTGSDAFGASFVFPAGTSKVEPGLAPRQDEVLAWPTFSAAADEAGVSRRYGGIHFKQGDLDGRVLGRTVGGQVWQKASRCFTGFCL